jgi:hypothetical protein
MCCIALVLSVGMQLRFGGPILILLKRWHFVCRFTAGFQSAVSSFRVAHNGKAFVQGGLRKHYCFHTHKSP